MHLKKTQGSRCKYIYIIYQTWWFWTCISGFNYGESLKFHGAQIVSFRYCQFVFFEGVGSACFFFNRGVFRQKTIAFANSWGLSLLAGFPLGSTFAIMDYHGWGHEGLNSLVQHDYESIISGGETTAFWGGPLLSPNTPGGRNTERSSCSSSYSSSSGAS